MKTIEEIKAAVNAHIESICEDGKQSKFVWGAVWMREGAAMYSLVIPSMLSAGGYVGDLPDVAIQILYALLGLEAAEAVERQKDQLVYFCGLYNDECARSAKLVEALEKISKQVVRVGIDNMWAVQNKFQEIADAALAAHKKGGQNGQ